MKKQARDPSFRQMLAGVRAELDRIKKHPRDPRFYQIRNAVRTNLKEAARLVATDPSIVHAKNGAGETALHYLVVENAFAEVEWLRQHGADIDPATYFGETALMEAAGLGNLKMGKYLVSHGANPRHISPAPFGTASALSSAAQNEQIKVVKYLLGLLDAGEDINQYFSDDDAYTIRISKRCPRSAKILLARGLRKIYFKRD
jgi:hypothetical protein